MTEAITKPSTQTRWRITATLDGNDTGVWDKLSGGDRDSEDPTYPPGGMGEPIPLGGRATTDPVVISRIYDLERDHQYMGTLLGRVGKGTMVVTKQPLDEDGLAFGDPIVYTGKLKRCSGPEVDSESSDPAMLECEVTTPGAPVTS